MRKKYLLLFSIFFFNLFFALAQPGKQSDTMHLDSAKIVQLEMMQQYQQEKIDSLVKIRLQKELENVQGNLQKTKELEDKLRLIAVNDSLRKAEQLRRINELKKNTEGNPVAPFGDTLFTVYIHTGFYNSNERAAAISKRITLLYESSSFYADSLSIMDSEAGTIIIYRNDLVIMGVSDLDALWFNKDKMELAKEYLEKIKKAVIDERDENSLVNWLKRIGLAILIIIGAGLLIYFINYLFKLLNRLLDSYRAKLASGITIGKIKLIKPEHQEMFLRRLLKLLRMIVIVISLYLCLPLLFNIFPETNSWTGTLLEWIISPAKAIMHSVIAFLPDLFTIIIIYLFTSYIVKAVRYVTKEIEKGDIHIPGFYKEFANPTFNILRFILYTFMLVIIFPYLPGSDSPAFQGVSVFLGILISLGSSSAINNIIAGLVITYMRPFKIGDRVQIGDTVGDVIEKSMLVIRIRTIKNEDITVPNSTVLSSNTINFSVNAADTGLIIHSTVTIGYDVPWKAMHKTLTDAALRTAFILKDPMPFVLQTSLDDFYVSYEINAYTRDAVKQAAIYSELHQNIQDCCNEAGIEIMSPHYSNMRDGNMTTIPATYLPKDYQAPAFNVKQVKDQKGD